MVLQIWRLQRMTFNTFEALKYFQFNSFAKEQIIHAIFTRHGGVSPQPWKSLNLGGTTGDERSNVIENRQRIFTLIGKPVESIHDTWQVHGDRVLCVEKPRILDSPHIKADAILTNKPEITLLMRFADCVPIFLFDPIKKVVGIVHAGWQGTVKRIASAAVNKMSSQYGSCPENILAGIGPSIGVDHYEVGLDVHNQVKRVYGDLSHQVLIERNGRCFFDLWRANELNLNASGVFKVEISGICTASNLEDWYSHRGEYGKTGRFAAVISLKNNDK